MNFIKVKNKTDVVILSDLHPELQLGGGGAIAYEFHNLLDDLGYSVQFWFTTSNKEFINKQNENEIGIFSSNPRTRFGIKFREILGVGNLLKVLMLTLKFRPKVIWVHQIGNHWPYLLIPVLRFFQVKIIFTFHDYLVLSKYKIDPIDSSRNEVLGNVNVGTSNYQIFRRTLLRTMANSANQTTAVSNLQKQILEEFQIRIDVVVPNGVAPCVHEIFLENDFPESISNLLFAGRLNRKGLDIMCDAVIQAKSGWILHLAGDNDLFDYCSMRLDSEKFKYHGKLSRFELGELIHKMDLVGVCSQYYDPYPTVGLEALRHGSFFLSTNTAGISHIYSSAVSENLIFEIGKVPDLDSALNFINDNLDILDAVKNRLPTPMDTCKIYLEMIDELISP